MVDRVRQPSGWPFPFDGTANLIRSATKFSQVWWLLEPFKRNAIMMNKTIQAQSCLNQLCYQRLTSPDFAQKLSFKTRLIRWMKGGAK